MMKVLRRELFFSGLVSVTVAACSSPSSSDPSPSPTDASSTTESNTTGADAGSEVGAMCHLLAGGNSGTLTLTGTACGSPVSYTSPAQLIIDVEPSSFTAGDAGAATYIEISDGDPSIGNPRSSGYFASHDVYLNLAIAGSFNYSGSNTSPISSGLFEGCGFGAMALAMGTLSVTFSGGSVQAHADNLPVSAFDPHAFGSLQVTACTGTVSLQFQGPYKKL